MSDTPKNPPTARSGIRASLAGEAALAVKADAKTAGPIEQPRPEQPPAEASANTTGASLLNVPGTPQDKWPDTAPPERVFDFEDGAHWHESQEAEAFLLEALHAYKAQLIGLRTRIEGELDTGFAGSLNPAGYMEAAKNSLRVVRKAIAQTEAMLAELGEVKA